MTDIWRRLDIGSPIGFDLSPEDYVHSFAELIVPRRGKKEKTPVDIVAPANYCEFYVNAVSEVTVDPDPLRPAPLHSGSWFKFYISVDERSLVQEQHGTIVCVGATAVYPPSKMFRHPDATVTKYFEGFPVVGEPGYYKIDVEPCEPWKGATAPYDVGNVRFFIEVVRESGELVRLWVDNNGTGFCLKDFWDPKYPVLSYKANKWISEIYLNQGVPLDAPIFYQKRHCTHVAE